MGAKSNYTGRTKTEGYSANGHKLGRPVIWDERNLTYISEELVRWLLAEDDNLFLYRFAKEYNIDSRMFSEESYLQCKAFTENISKAKHIIEQKLMEKGLKGEFQQAMSIFTLKNKYGWRDEVDHHHNMLPISINFNILPPSESKIPDQLPQSDTPYEVLPPDQLPQPVPKEQPPKKDSDTISETEETTDPF